ncbi:MAG: acyl-CoA/acyl-ACP dehydrogenase [Proteobacteria bacterium]|nr:acyl-CoA/acyl-ACP dehydrogenase [Pseudomonadota bacterium]
MAVDLGATFEDIRAPLRALCARFPGEYWRRLDRERAYPAEFVAALTEAGYLAAPIPERYGGSGLGVAAGAAILEEIHKSGCNGGACHAQMYTMGTLLRHGSEEQKAAYLPAIASGELRLQAFAVTEPEAGTDTTRLRTSAERTNDGYVVNGRKIFISRAEHSDLMLLLARTTPLDKVARRTEGLSVFLVDLRQAVGRGLTIRLSGLPVIGQRAARMRRGSVTGARQASYAIRIRPPVDESAAGPKARKRSASSWMCNLKARR